VLTHEIMNSAAPIASLAATAGSLLARSGGDAGDGGAAEAVHDTREALEAIQRRSEALMHFVASYRSFTQIRQPDFRAFPALDLFRQVERLFRVQAEERGIDLRHRVDPADLTLTADEELVEQVLINLLLNAMDAVAGRPAARVELRARLDRYGHVLLQVADNGPGIPPDLQERIFIPFFTTKPEGSGIGLSLSRQILRLHGGTLRVRSDPGAETVFTLRF
jgi:two-component system nitrogen regulation sensor histidine kinase NtrY